LHQAVKQLPVYSSSATHSIMLLGRVEAYQHLPVSELLDYPLCVFALLLKESICNNKVVKF